MYPFPSSTDGTNRRAKRPVSIPPPPTPGRVAEMGTDDRAGALANAQAGPPPIMPQTNLPVAQPVQQAPTQVAPGVNAMNDPAGLAANRAMGAPPNVPGQYSAHVGEPTAGLNRTGKALAEIRALQTASPLSKVQETPWGYEEQPPPAHVPKSWQPVNPGDARPEGSPSRLKHALLGALEGAIIGGQKGLASAIGGAGAGAVTGAASPRLVAALMRDQEIKSKQGDLAGNLALEKEGAQIGSIQSQTEENRARAGYYDTQGGQQDRNRATQVYRALDHYKRGERPDLDQLFDDAGVDFPDKVGKEAAEVDYTDPEGRHFKVSPDKAATLYQGDRKPLTPNTQASEGNAAYEQSQAEYESVKAEMNDLKKPAQEGRDSITKKDAIWRTEAARRLKDASKNYVSGVGVQPTMQAMLDQVKSEDPDFISGTYDQTVTNTEAKEKKIGELEKQLQELKKEGRAGKAKAAGATAIATPKQPGADGKTHYTLAEIKAAAGADFDKVLKIMRGRSDVVIDR